MSRGNKRKEHLNLVFLVKSKIKERIIKCNSRNKKDKDSLMNHFVVIKKSLSNYSCKIHEALLIKKHHPKLNKQLYENGVSLILQLL